MQATDQTNVINGGKVIANGYVATQIHDDMSWGGGAIKPQADYVGEDAQVKLIEAVLQSIEPVSDAELPYSSCTDGRIPVKLMNGEAIPVREQMVGADMVSAFYVAEILGDSFYKNAAAPAVERVEEVAAFLQENGLLPSSHIACGAGAGFVTIMENVAKYAADARFAARERELVPDGIYDADLHDTMIAAAQTRLAKKLYDDLSAQTFLDAVAKVSGDRAIAELKDDGRGVHGHVEEHIIRVRVPGYAINESKVAKITGGREVFGVSDTRIDKIARLFGRGSDNDYRMAYMALEDFTDAGHGTLAAGLPTWVVEAE
ncbi:MAG: hypothetical protein ABWX94_02145 [Candidatus Saccharimonadales bacterium]